MLLSHAGRYEEWETVGKEEAERKWWTGTSMRQNTVTPPFLYKLEGGVLFHDSRMNRDLNKGARIWVLDGPEGNDPDPLEGSPVTVKMIVRIRTISSPWISSEWFMQLHVTSNTTRNLSITVPVASSQMDKDVFNTPVWGDNESQTRASVASSPHPSSVFLFSVSGRKTSQPYVRLGRQEERKDRMFLPCLSFLASFSATCWVFYDHLSLGAPCQHPAISGILGVICLFLKPRDHPYLGASTPLDSPLLSCSH